MGNTRNHPNSFGTYNIIEESLGDIIMNEYEEMQQDLANLDYDEYLQKYGVSPCECCSFIASDGKTCTLVGCRFYEGRKKE